MKNGKTILLIVLAFTIGYVIRMLVEPKVDDPRDISQQIPQGEAQILSDNYAGLNRYVVLDSDFQELLADAAATTPDHTGFVMYYAASRAGSDISDRTIFAAIRDNAVVGPYYLMNATSYRSTCPKMCDIQGLFEREPPIPEPISEPVDSVIPDNEEHPQ